MNDPASHAPVSVATQSQVQTFQCPKCREYINASASRCRFCGAEVDSSSAAAQAEIQEKVAQAVNQARLARVGVWFMPAFWLNLILFYGIGIETGIFVFLPVMILVSTVGVIVGWWTRFGKLQTDDPDYAKARHGMKTTVVLFVLMIVVPLPLFLMGWGTVLIKWFMN